MLWGTIVRSGKLSASHRHIRCGRTALISHPARPARPAGRLTGLAAVVGLMSAGLFTVAAPQAQAVGSFNNAVIADYAVSHYPVGTYAGQCRTFVNNVVKAATGLNVGTGWPDYFIGFTNVGAQRITDVNALQKGDIVQYGETEGDPTLHTFIILSRNSGANYRIIDSNHLHNERVDVYNRTITLSNSDRAYQLGQVAGNGGAGGGGSNVGSLAAGGGFEGGGSWTPYPGTHTNMVAYRNGQVAGESAHSGLHYLATNTSSAGGGVYEDIPLSTSAGGGLYCGSVWVRTQARATGAGGQFVLWLLGGSYNENGVASFSGLSNGTNWRQVSTCVSSTTPHTLMRIQFYPTVNGPTLEADDVDVH